MGLGSLIEFRARKLYFTTMPITQYVFTLCHKVWMSPRVWFRVEEFCFGLSYFLRCTLSLAITIQKTTCWILMFIFQHFRCSWLSNYVVLPKSEWWWELFEFCSPIAYNKKWFRPANGMQSTCLLVEIHNSHIISALWSNTIRQERFDAMTEHQHVVQSFKSSFFCNNFLTFQRLPKSFQIKC